MTRGELRDFAPKKCGAPIAPHAELITSDVRRVDARKRTDECCGAAVLFSRPSVRRLGVEPLRPRQCGGECSYLPKHVSLIRQKHEEIRARQFDDASRGDGSELIALPSCVQRATGIASSPQQVRAPRWTAQRKSSAVIVHSPTRGHSAGAPTSRIRTRLSRDLICALASDRVCVIGQCFANQRLSLRSIR
jgi:hypothetical protein